MDKAKRARTAETPKQPSLGLKLRAPCLYPDQTLMTRRAWRNRADEARAVAERISDPAARLDMLRIAEACAQMAV